MSQDSDDQATSTDDDQAQDQPSQTVAMVSRQLQAEIMKN